MPPRALGSRDRESSRPTHAGRRAILAIPVPGRSIPAAKPRSVPAAQAVSQVRPSSSRGPGPGLGRSGSRLQSLGSPPGHAPSSDSRTDGVRDRAHQTVGSRCGESKPLRVAAAIGIRLALNLEASYQLASCGRVGELTRTSGGDLSILGPPERVASVNSANGSCMLDCGSARPRSNARRRPARRYISPRYA